MTDGLAHLTSRVSGLLATRVWSVSMALLDGILCGNCFIQACKTKLQTLSFCKVFFFVWPIKIWENDSLYSKTCKRHLFLEI